MSTNDQAPTKRRGRPSLPVDDRKSANLKFRTRGGLRDRLEAAAQSSGRSVSEEVEHRLEMSFANSLMQESASGGRVPHHVGSMFGRAYLDAHHAANELYGIENKWYNNDEKFKFIEQYCLLVLSEHLKMHAETHKRLGASLMRGVGPAMQFNTALQPDPSLFSKEGDFAVRRGQLVRLAHGKRSDK